MYFMLPPSAIQNELKADTEKLWVTPDGKQLYVAIQSGEILCFVGNFEFMTGDEINAYIVEQLT